MRSAPHIVIKAQSGWSGFNMKEFWQYRDLLYFMVLRDITVIYKQSVLGFAWAIINPVFSMLVFTVVFGTLAGVPSDNIPYPIFSYAALIPWTYFSNALNASGSSLVTNSSIFTKVYFPRLIIPLTPILSKLADFSISFLLLAFMMVYYRFMPGWELLYLPLLILIMMMTTFGLGMWTAALAIQYRDVKFALTFVIPLLMYAAPVVFPASLIEEKFGYQAYLLYGLYPMSGVIEGFRAAIVPGKAMPWDLIGMGALSATVLLLLGGTVFRRMENKFADVA